MTDEKENTERKTDKAENDRIYCPMCGLPIHIYEHGNICLGCGYRFCSTCGDR